MKEREEKERTNERKGDWRDCSVGEGLAMQAWGPEVSLKHLCLNKTRPSGGGSVIPAPGRPGQETPGAPQTRVPQETYLQTPDSEDQHQGWPLASTYACITCTQRHFIHTHIHTQHIHKDTHRHRHRHTPLQTYTEYICSWKKKEERRKRGGTAQLFLCCLIIEENSNYRKHINKVGQVSNSCAWEFVEAQEFRIILGYTDSSRLTWTTWNPASKKKKDFIYKYESSITAIQKKS